MKFAWYLRWHLLGRKMRVSSVAVLLLLALFAISTAGFWHLEKDQDLSLADSFWLSFVTMTTVGYGDIAPQSLAGRLFAMLVTMSCGIGIMAYMITLLAASVVEREAKRVKGLQKVKFSGHILIINCPNEDKVLTLIKEIRMDSKTEDVPIVLISGDIDQCPDTLLNLPYFQFVHGNPLLGRVLEMANATKASQAIILARDTKDPNSDGVTTQVAIKLETMCKSCGKDIYTVAEVVSKDSIEPLHAAGVEDVICIETVISPILVQAMLDPGVGALIEQLVSNRSGSQYYVGDVSFLAGKTYQDIQQSLADQSHLRVIPIALAQNGIPTINPEGSTLIQKGDTLFYIANKRQELEKTLASLV